MNNRYMINTESIDNSRVTKQEYERNLWYQKNLVELGLTVPYDDSVIEQESEIKLKEFNSYGEYELAKMKAKQYLDSNMEVPPELRMKLIREKQNLNI